MFTLTFATSNAAFQDGQVTLETCRILREIADKLEAGMCDGAAYDLNGNRVGSFVLKHKDAT